MLTMTWKALLIILSTFSVWILPLAHTALYGQESGYPLVVSEEGVDAETGATDMRSRDTLESAPGSARLYYESGRSYLRLKNYSAALIRFDKAVELDPMFAEAHYLRARTYLKLNEPEKALRDFSRSIELHPKDERLMGGCLYSRGVLFMGMEKYGAAVEDFSRAIELLPGYAIIYRKRGASYLELGQYDKALWDLEAAVNIKPELAAVLEPEIQELRKKLAR
jgi:tetratricopeptide (TPR) repeat protein